MSTAQAFIVDIGTLVLLTAMMAAMIRVNRNERRLMDRRREE
jgi:hypothetical protein